MGNKAKKLVFRLDDYCVRAEVSFCSRSYGKKAGDFPGFSANDVCESTNDDFVLLGML